MSSTGKSSIGQNQPGVINSCQLKTCSFLMHKRGCSGAASAGTSCVVASWASLFLQGQIAMVQLEKEWKGHVWGSPGTALSNFLMPAWPPCGRTSHHIGLSSCPSIQIQMYEMQFWLLLSSGTDIPKKGWMLLIQVSKKGGKGAWWKCLSLLIVSGGSQDEPLSVRKKSSWYLITYRGFVLSDVSSASVKEGRKVLSPAQWFCLSFPAPIFILE